jgi:hypothetical protein
MTEKGGLAASLGPPQYTSSRRDPFALPKTFAVYCSPFENENEAITSVFGGHVTDSYRTKVQYADQDWF